MRLLLVAVWLLVVVVWLLKMAVAAEGSFAAIKSGCDATEGSCQQLGMAIWLLTVAV